MSVPHGAGGQLRSIIGLYLVGTLGAAFIAVAISTLFPTELILRVSEAAIEPPKGIGEVLNNLVFKIVDNPVSAIMNSPFKITDFRMNAAGQRVPRTLAKSFFWSMAALN